MWTSGIFFCCAAELTGRDSKFRVLGQRFGAIFFFLKKKIGRDVIWWPGMKFLFLGLEHFSSSSCRRGLCSGCLFLVARLLLARIRTQIDPFCFFLLLSCWAHKQRPLFSNSFPKWPRQTAAPWNVLQSFAWIRTPRRWLIYFGTRAEAAAPTADRCDPKEMKMMKICNFILLTSGALYPPQVRRTGNIFLSLRLAEWPILKVCLESCWSRPCGAAVKH